MAFNVRVFGYRGIAQLKTDIPQQFAADSVQVLVEPYEWAQLLVVAGVAVSSVPVANDHARLIRIEVPDGQTIRYEINPIGRSAVAGNPSPSMSGKDQFFWGTGWSISIIDAAGLP